MLKQTGDCNRGIYTATQSPYFYIEQYISVKSITARTPSISLTVESDVFNHTILNISGVEGP